uniref:leucine-rich repeat protein n=1 Tax=Labilibaculum sp. TaxID=2060723 RepID=UPI0035636252
MMKRSTLILTVLLFMCMAFSSQAQQYTLTDDDVVVTDGEIMSCSYDYSSTDIIIPDTLDGQTVISIWGDPSSINSVFQNKGLTSVQLPETLQEIGRYVFNKNSLTEISLPAGLTTMGTSAFSNNQLTSVTIPEGVSTLEYQVFCYNKLTSLLIPDGVTIIETNAFSNNELVSVSLPNSVYKIEDAAFAFNTDLSSFFLPSVSISGQTFLNWIDNEGNTYENGEEVFNVASSFVAQFAYTLTSDDVEVSNGVIISCSLPDYTNNITIPEVLDEQTIIGLGSGLFLGKDLTAIDLPQTLTSIDDYVFYFCMLTSIDLPTDLTSIGQYAFAANNLSEVLFPESLTTIGDGAFTANSLTKLDIPDGVSRIESSTFRQNYDLAEISFPDSLSYIGNYAFSYCYDLSAVSIPSAVSYIGSYAFYNSGLSSFTLPAFEEKGYTAYWLGSDDAEYAAGSEVTDISLSYSLNVTINTYAISGSLTGADDVLLFLSGDYTDSLTISSGNDYSFDVDYNSNVVLTAEKIGYQFETREYTFENVYGDQTEINFVATESENLYPPTIADEKLYIEENSAIGTELATLTIEDEDVLAEDYYLFALTDTTGMFEINTETGLVSLIDNQKLDYETYASIPISVSVYDYKHDTVSKEISVILVNVNEAPTAIQLLNNSIAENSAIGSEVGTLTATDEDADQTLTYSISENENFEISGDKLFSKSDLDFETQESYELEITVTDQDGLSYSESVSIEITNVNEAPTSISLSNAIIVESSVSAILIGSFTASDADADQTFTYSIAENENFEISEDILLSKKVLSSDTDYSVEITVTDQGGLTFTETFTIQVIANDYVPVILSSEFFVDENSESGTFVGQIEIEDQDEFENPVVYSFERGKYSDYFSIDETSGEITVRSYNSLNYEDKSSYDISVYVEDTRHVVSKDIIIYLNDVNEAPYNLSLSNYTVPSDAAVGDEIAEFSASDPDDAAILTYSITENDYFYLEGTSLLLKSAITYEEGQSYTVSLTATDENDLSTSSDFTLT